MKRGGYCITRDKFLSPDELKQVMVATQDKAIIDKMKGRKTWVTRYALTHLAFYSGLRVSEIAALKVCDIHLNGKQSYLIVRRGKGGKTREVYFDHVLAKHIGEYLETKQKAWGESVDDDSPLFSGIPGKHYSTTALHLSFKRAMENAGMPNRISIHGARHTFATLLLEKTKNLRYVQLALGHASLNMTALYANVIISKKAAYANAILD